jgi:hypothetical protein
MLSLSIRIARDWKVFVHKKMVRLFLKALLFGATACAPVVLAQSTGTLLDLTSEIPSTERGVPGIPGARAGGSNAGSLGPSRYRLPLVVGVLRSSINEKGLPVVEVLLKNVGNAPFELPSSRNLTEIERPGNRSQRVFFIDLQTVPADKVGK